MYERSSRMKVFRAILTILGCALIVLGGYSAVTFLMQRDFAPVQEPTVEAPQPAEPEQPEETPEEPTQPAEDPELEARHSRAQEILRDMSLEEKIYQLMFVRPEAITGVDHPRTRLVSCSTSLRLFMTNFAKSILRSGKKVKGFAV